MKLLIASLALLLPALASAQSLTINAPGSYVLAADSLSTGIYNVYINADDVTLDLNSKVVRCQPPTPASAVTFGIYASGRSRITIKNGTITGCMFGIHAGYSAFATLENVHLSANTYIGANLGYSHHATIRRSTCVNTAGYTPEAYAICINGIGDHGLVEFSTFKNTYRQASGGTGEGVGILIEQNATDVTIRNNTLLNDTHQLSTIGIWSAAGSSVAITDNTITNFHVAIQGSGLTVIGNTIALTETREGNIAISANGLQAANNTIRGYDSVFSGGIADGGGNTIEPIATPTPTGKFFRICVDGVCYEGILPVAPGG